MLELIVGASLLGAVAYSSFKVINRPTVERKEEETKSK